MSTGISSTFTIFMILKTLLWVIGNAGVETTVVAEKNVNKVHNEV